MALTREHIEFIKAAIRNPLEVSTVFPTSRSLAETLLSQADVLGAESVVELGAGTGAITRFLRPKLGKKESYLGIELDPKMVAFLRREFTDLKFETGLAEELPQWKSARSVDVVVSSLPWSVFGPETQEKTLEAIRESLKPGGVFLTYVCVNAMLYPSARRFIDLMKANFRVIERTPLEWRNVPPAFVFKAKK